MISKITKYLLKKIIACSCLFLLTGISFAQEQVSTENSESSTVKNEDVLVLTLEDVVAYSREHSLSLQSSALDFELLKWKNNTSWNSFLPTVQFTGSLSRPNDSFSSFKMAGTYNSAMAASKPSEKELWSAVGNFSVSLNFNAAMIMNMKATKESYEVGKITYEQALKSNDVSVKKMFYNILLQRESLELQKSSLENALQRMNQAAINYRNGYVPQIQYLQAQVAYENQVPSVEKAELALNQSLDTFSFMIGLPVGTKISLDGEINPRFVDIEVEKLIEEAQNNNLSIRSARQNLEMLKTQKASLDLSAYTPSLALSWNGQPMMTKAFDKDWGNKDNWADNGALSFSLVWNVTNMLPWSSSRTTAKELQTSVDKLELNLKTLLRNTELEVRAAVDSLNQCKRSIESSQRNIILAQSSYDMTWLAYRNGTTEYLNLMEAQTQLDQAKLGLISEKFNYLSDLMDLEQIINATILEDK